uniref:Uncharacterized protein n=1 Tax=Craspedostauros australis TaxID=1486917 RepID=A0A7R9ZQF5_9STRA|mmetsp:Transcript_5736/g.15545  ORF Transcript_5736/g.15545 Transcript_5736/m.15545 type:complete len:250 (+) Transcript_5736:130-879(+)
MTVCQFVLNGQRRRECVGLVLSRHDALVGAFAAPDTTRACRIHHNDDDDRRDGGHDWSIPFVRSFLVVVGSEPPSSVAPMRGWYQYCVAEAKSQPPVLDTQHFQSPMPISRFFSPNLDNTTTTKAPNLKASALNLNSSALESKQCSHTHAPAHRNTQTQRKSRTTAPIHFTALRHRSYCASPRHKLDHHFTANVVVGVVVIARESIIAVPTLHEGVSKQQPRKNIKSPPESSTQERRCEERRSWVVIWC